MQWRAQRRPTSASDGVDHWHPPALVTVELEVGVTPRTSTTREPATRHNLKSIRLERDRPETPMLPLHYGPVAKRFVEPIVYSLAAGDVGATGTSFNEHNERGMAGEGEHNDDRTHARTHGCMDPHWGP